MIPSDIRIVHIVVIAFPNDALPYTEEASLVPTVPKHLQNEPRLATAYKEGHQACREKVINLLHEKWLGPDAPDRGTPEAEFFLNAVREISGVMD